VIEFPTEYPETKLLKKAVRWSIRHRYHIPSLTELSPGSSMEELIEIGRQWQKAGLGRMIEQSDHGRRSVHFSLNDHAVMAVRQMDERSILGRLKSVNRSDWIAVGAFIVSVIALFKPGA
jgi:hypothetical protein